jgi:hypothetical protein
VDEQPGLKPSRRERSWVLPALAVVSGLLAAGLAGVLSAPRWLQALCTVAGVALGVLLGELQRRRAQTEQHARELRSHVAGAREQLLTVRTVSLDGAGVHRALVEVPYVQRDAEREVTRTLGEHGRVLIVGFGLQGKSRLALHVAQQLFAEHAFLKPNDGKALHQLMVQGHRPQRVLVWLDRLERFLADGLSGDDLDTFCRDGNVAVATIGSGAYNARNPLNGYETTGWDVLKWFDPEVWLPPTWTHDELERAQAVVAPEVLQAATRPGLSAYLAAGPMAIKRLRAGESECPEGYALVRAAADWRRVGRSSAIPREVLVAVLPAYLPSPGKEPDAAVEEGLEWAKQSPDATTGVGALVEETNGGYEVRDYLVEDLTRQKRPIPEEMRDAAEQDATTGELLDVALQAVRQEREDRAEAAWEGLDHPLAMYNLGVLHERRGDLGQARHWWEAAANAGDPGAMYRLGVLLLQQGARREADHWMRRAAKAAGRPTADKLADAPVGSADARIAFSGTATDAQQQPLIAALRDYMAYLERLQAPLGTVPTVHLVPGTDITYPHGAQRRLIISTAWGPHTPDVLLHEYSHWVLDSLVRPTRDTWTDDIMDVESGFAYYLPCSFRSSPSITGLDLRAPARVPPQLGPEHRVGLRWAGALWEVRGCLDHQLLDQALLDTWRATSPTDEDRAGFATRLGQRLQDTIGPSARQSAQATLVSTGLLEG